MKREERLDKMIRQNLGTVKTGEDFTSKLMQKISVAESEKEILLKQLLVKNIPEEPYKDFTLKIMRKISADSKGFVYQPVISKRVWYFISAAVVLFIVTIILTSELGKLQSDKLSRYFLKSVNIFSADYPSILNSPLLAMSMFVMSLLFFLDYYIRNRKYS